MGLPGPMIRPAKFNDIPVIVSLMIDGWSRSNLKDIDTIDVKEAKAVIMATIQRHTPKYLREGGGCVFITDDGHGFIMGVIDRLYHVGTRLCAQDIFFYADPDCGGWDKVGLLDAYVEWALTIPNLAVIRNGITDIITDTDRVQELYERHGFTKSGVLMERKIACPAR